MGSIKNQENQHFILVNSYVDFADVMNTLLKQGWKVVPGTIVVTREGWTKVYMAVLEKPIN